MTEALQVKLRFTTDVPSSDLQSVHGSDVTAVIDDVGCRAKVKFGDVPPNCFESNRFRRREGGIIPPFGHPRLP
jgi:hypothetical protein